MGATASICADVGHCMSCTERHAVEQLLTAFRRAIDWLHQTCRSGSFCCPAHTEHDTHRIFENTEYFRRHQ